MATKFNDVVAMDLRIWHPGIYLLHLIRNVMKMWIGNGMRAPNKFLADNGGEFANAEYRDMCENLNIEFTNTAAYSPWQDGLCG